MTKISKKIITWLLGAVAFVAVALGIVFTRPQTKTVSADTVEVSWNTGALSIDEINDYTRIRFNTSKLQWKSYNNTSYEDNYLAYTKVNGKTVKELNAEAAAAGSSDKIWACLQPAGSFSFYSICIPDSFELLSVEDIYLFEVEAGWSSVDSGDGGTGNTYVNSTPMRWNYRAREGFKFNSGVNKDIAAAANMSFNSQGQVDGGSTCFIFATKELSSLWTAGDNPIALNAPVLNGIYINGKSINDWNAEAQAAVNAGEVSDILYGSTNNVNVQAGAPIAVLPGFANDANFGAFMQIYIANDFLAEQDVYSFELETGFSYMRTGTYDAYYASTFIRFDSLGSGFRRVTEFVDLDTNIRFIDQGISSAGVNCFLIAFGGEVQCSAYYCLNDNYAKVSPLTGLSYGENLDYITINGKTLGQIKAENPDYDYTSSSHNNIKNGGVYAPIFAHMAKGNVSPDAQENFIQIFVPTDLIDPSTITEIGLSSRFFNYDSSTKTKYGLSEDITFVKEDGSWGFKMNEIQTTVTDARIFGSGDVFAGIKLADSDYNTAPNTYGGEVNTAKSYATSGNFLAHVLIDDAPVSGSGEAYLNVWSNFGYFCFRPGVDAQKITILAGCKLPTYKNLSTGEKEVYVTTEDVTFVKVDGEWVRQQGDATEYTVTVDGVQQTVAAGGKAVAPATPTKPEDASNIYTFDNWYIVDTDTVFDFNTAILQDYEVESRFVTKIKTTVEMAQIFGTSDAFAGIKVVGNDYSEAPNTYPDGFTPKKHPKDYAHSDNFLAHVYLDDVALNYKGEAFLNVWGNYGYFCFRPGNNAATKITIKAGLEIPTYNNLSTGAKEVYVVTEDITFVKQNGAWASDSNLVYASDVTISDAKVDGEASELQIVSITSAKWNSTCSPFDYNYGGFVSLRQNIFINGVSVHEINTTVDDSAYVYSTSPSSNNDGTFEYNGVTYDLFKNPVVLYGSGDTLKLWIHKDYLASVDANEIVVSVAAGFAYCDKLLTEEVSAVVSANYTVRVEDWDGTLISSQVVSKGGYATSPATPTRPNTATAEYTFTGWKDSEGNDFSFGSTKITGNVTVIAQYSVYLLAVDETEIVSIRFQYVSSVDTWLIFTLSNHDYACELGQDNATNQVSMTNLNRNGLLDNIILKGDLLVGGVSKTEATLAEIINASSNGRSALINYWEIGSIGIRVPDLPSQASIQEIIIKEGAVFPSYQYDCLNTTEVDVRYTAMFETTFQFIKAVEKTNYYGSNSVASYDISMAAGAAIRIDLLNDYDGTENYMETTGYKKSGIRFQTIISKESIEKIQGLIGYMYESVSFGTLIVPSSDLTGGHFTHEWLDANGILYMDIKSTARLSADSYLFADETAEYVTFFGSIVNLKQKNHSRYFSGVGYIKVELTDGTTAYYYAPYNSAYSRSAAYIAQAAVADRNNAQTDYYKNKINENNNWSPYTEGENKFLKLYMGNLTNTEVAAESFTLTSTGELASVANSRNTGTLTVNKNLNGAYVQLNYNTDVDVWGKFYYKKSGSSTEAVEDFYLQKGTSQHKQFLDIYRTNGVGTKAGITASDTIYLSKIEFQNATVDTYSTGTFKFLGLYSKVPEDITTTNMEVYVTKQLANGGDMTVGAHLGLGGSLTYLAKSGISEWTASSKRVIGLSSNKPSSTSNVLDGSSSSKAGTGVNLINNWDAGRQIQQSWYGGVGGTLDGNTGANGYTRLYCTTGDGGYWPYNPVQAGDCVSNPGQIVDYEVNETEGYIYVKARAMDWAYGDTKYGGVAGGVTTKSYMENYYRLYDDGTVYVNNSFIDWSGFTDTASSDFCAVELPALYPVHPLNWFTTYEGSNPWTGGALTKNDELESWTKNPHYQHNTDTTADGKLGEEWVAWSCDEAGSFAMGMYIPNVDRLTSGRSQKSTGTITSANRDGNSNELKKLGLMANMPSIKNQYQSCYVSNTSYTAPGASYRIEEYVAIEYTYVLSLNDVATIRNQFEAIHNSGKVTNAGSRVGDKVGLDAWAREDKLWTQV